MTMNLTDPQHRSNNTITERWVCHRCAPEIACKRMCRRLFTRPIQHHHLAVIVYRVTVAEVENRPRGVISCPIDAQRNLACVPSRESEPRQWERFEVSIELSLFSDLFVTLAGTPRSKSQISNVVKRFWHWTLFWPTHARCRWFPAKGNRAASSRPKKRLWKRKPPRSLSPEVNEKKSLTQVSHDRVLPEDRLEERDLLQHESGSMTLHVIVPLFATSKHAVHFGKC